MRNIAVDSPLIISRLCDNDVRDKGFLPLGLFGEAQRLLSPGCRVVSSVFVPICHIIGDWWKNVKMKVEKSDDFDRSGGKE